MYIYLAPSNNNLDTQNTLLGGINMVDYNPWSGNYTGVIVTNNTIAGGFANGSPTGSQVKGTNNEDVIIKYVCPVCGTQSVSSFLLELVLPSAHALGLEMSTGKMSAPGRRS